MKTNHDNIGLIRESGDKCPISGAWGMLVGYKIPIPVKKDEIFPQQSGKKVSFVCISEDIQSIDYKNHFYQSSDKINIQIPSNKQKVKVG